MKRILTIALILLANELLAQSDQAVTPSQYEKFIVHEGSLILTSNENIFETGGLETLEISKVEAKDVTRNEEIKAILISVNKSDAYLSKKEAQLLMNQMKKIQLLLVDGEVEKEDVVSFNIRRNLLIEVSYNTSKKTWKYEIGVNRDGRKRMKEVTATEFQDIKISLEKQIETL